MITFIGDAHGEWQTLNKLIAGIGSGPIIQIGDLGLGFNPKDGTRTFPDNFKFIRGNHDNPAICRKNASYLGDYGYLPEYKLAFISGAHSIDRHLRREGFDWWADEELAYAEMQNAIDLVLEKKPDILVTHDGPKFLYNDLTEGIFSRMGEPSNSTCAAFDVLFELYKPKLWVFGHHHKPKDYQIRDCELRCVPTLKTYSVDIPS